MDFDDLLGVTVEVLRQFPEVLEHYQRRFGHVLVDEYQDTNPVQNELVLLLGANHRNVCVVGDQRPVDLPVPGRRHPQHRRLRDGVPGRHRGAARAELPVDPDDPRRRQRGDRPQRRAASPRSCGPTRARATLIQRFHADDEADEAQWVVGRMSTPARPGPALGRHGGLLPDQRPEPGAGGVPHPQRHPVQGGRRHPLLRPPRDQGRGRLPEGGGEPGRRGGGQAGPQHPQAGRRRRIGRPGSTPGPPARASPSSRRCGGPTRPASAAGP